MSPLCKNNRCSHFFRTLLQKGTEQNVAPAIGAHSEGAEKLSILMDKIATNNEVTDGANILPLNQGNHLLVLFEGIVKSIASDMTHHFIQFLKTGEQSGESLSALEWFKIYHHILREGYQKLEKSLVSSIKSLYDPTMKLDVLESNIRRFDQLFDENVLNRTICSVYSRAEQNNTSTGEKIALLETFLIPVAAQDSAKYFQRSGRFLVGIESTLILIEELAEDSNMDLNDSVKQAYIFVYFALKFNQRKVSLKIKTAKYICTELLSKDDRDISAIFHLFTLLLYWPQMSSGFMERKNFLKSLECLTKYTLDIYETENVKCQQQEVFFRISRGNRRYVSAKNKSTKLIQRFKGNRLTDGTVELQLHGLAESVRIPIEKSRTRRRFTGASAQVAFELSFTNVGLLACNVEQSSTSEGLRSLSVSSSQAEIESAIQPAVTPPIGQFFDLTFLDLNTDAPCGEVKNNHVSFE